MAWPDGTTATRLGSELETAIRAHAELDRARRIREAQGVKTETYRRGLLSTSGNPASGTATGNPVAIIQGETYSRVLTEQNTLGTALTLVKFGLYDLSGNQLAVSADVSAAWGTIADKEISFITPYVAPADAVVVIMFLMIGTATPSQLRFSGGGGQIGSSILQGYSKAGQADLGSLTGWINQNAVYWLGLG